MQEFEYKEEYKYLSNIMLCVTDACNLACRYCFVEQHPNYMSLETAIDAVEWAYNNLKIKKEKGWISEKEKTSVFFFGGEPMLMFDSVIKPLIEYIKEKKYDIGFGITTNGTLLNEEKIKFLYDNKVGFLLSIDGFKATQDYNRPCQNGESSFDKIYSNIPILLKYYPQVTFRSTIYEDTVEHCFENYLFAEKMGFKSYFCVPDVLTSKWEQNKLDVLKEQIHKIFEYRFLQYSNNQIPMKFSREMDCLREIKNFILENNNDNNNCDPLNRCGLGIGLGAIGYNGNIYGCQEYTSQGDNHKFYIGNIYKNGINKTKHSNLLNMYLDGIYNQSMNQLCNNKDCIKYDICKQSGFKKLNCPAQNYHLFKSLNRKSEISCIYEQIVFKECLAMFQFLIENNNELFKEFISKI